MLAAISIEIAVFIPPFLLICLWYFPLGSHRKVNCDLLELLVVLFKCVSGKVFLKWPGHATSKSGSSEFTFLWLVVIFRFLAAACGKGKMVGFILNGLMASSFNHIIIITLLNKNLFYCIWCERSVGFKMLYIAGGGGQLNYYYVFIEDVGGGKNSQILRSMICGQPFFSVQYELEHEEYIV